VCSFNQGYVDEAVQRFASTCVFLFGHRYPYA
jgi:hypothetical protein